MRSPARLEPTRSFELPRLLHSGGGFQTLLALLAFVSIWCLGRTFPGIAGDALLYIGRGLADLDPDGVGRDLMFANDGQSGFSLFPLAVRSLVRLYGPASADLILVIIAQALWVIALISFVVRVTEGRPRLAFATLICVAVLPSFYGPFERFYFAETIAVPRPFAEALVVFALGALISRRDILAAVLVLAAASLHPIMALAGLGTLLLVKGMEDWRWLVATACIVIAVISCAWLGVPLAGRLFQQIDPAWRAVNLARNPLLFPSQWAFADFAAISVHAVSIAVAAHAMRGRFQRLLIASLIVGLAGLMASELLGDWASLLLIIQAQPWRTLWLMSLLAAVTFALNGAALWPRGPAFRLAFVMLVPGWCLIDQPIAIAFSAAALVVYALACRGRLAVGQYAVWAVAFAVAALVVILDMRQVAAYFEMIATSPSGAYRGFSGIWGLHLLSMPMAILAVAWACNGIGRINPIVATGVTALLLSTACFVWDDRSPFQKLMEADGPPQDLNKIIASQPGSVVWIDGIEETTFWLRRPNWYSAFQGTGAIFSRPLAIEWQSRKNEMIAQGLLPKADRGLPGEVITRPLPEVTQASVDGLCRRAETLAWIIVPVLEGSPGPLTVAALEWKPPLPVYKVIWDANNLRWNRIVKYALIDCASNRAHKASN